MPNFINYNGRIYPSSTKVLEVSNRSFRYGDGLFESMFARGKKVGLATFHFNRLTKGMEQLFFDIPMNFTPIFFNENIEKLLKHNKHFKGAKVRFHAFRNGNGNYLPNKNKFSFIIESCPVKQNKFQLNKEKIILDVFTEIQKPKNLLSGFKTANSLLFIQASLWAKKNNFQDCLIINSDGFICEALFSNVFVVVGNHLTTPNLGSGCVNGVMRNYVIKIALKNGYLIDEVSKLTPDLLLHADEVFLTNAVTGIRWVLGFKKRRYDSKHAAKLTAMINNSLGY